MSDPIADVAAAIAGTLFYTWWNFDKFPGLLSTECELRRMGYDGSEVFRGQSAREVADKAIAFVKGKRE
jgi:hypothetical protein